MRYIDKYIYLALTLFLPVYKAPVIPCHGCALETASYASVIVMAMIKHNEDDLVAQLCC